MFFVYTVLLSSYSEHDDSDCLQNAVDTHKLTEFTPSGWLSEQVIFSMLAC